jgi:hypothetical protein
MKVLFPLLFATAITGCGSQAENEGSGSAEEEESGRTLALDATYDQVRGGAQLVMAYDASLNSFVRRVENTTQETLRVVRVEVHLSNGTELGPTPSSDLQPGERLDATLTAAGETFDGWSAHPETSSCSGEAAGEHGDDGEHGEGSEHGEGGSGEHGRDRERG